MKELYVYFCEDGEKYVLDQYGIEEWYEWGNGLTGPGFDFKRLHRFPTNKLNRYEVKRHERWKKEQQRNKK
jgi:hypothetical protein